MSALEETLALQLRAAGIGGWVREYKFALALVPKRLWRLDFYFPAERVGIELQGGVWSSGRHVRGAGYSEDCAKANAATLAGIRLLRFTGGQVEDGTALATIERALKREESERARD